MNLAQNAPIQLAVAILRESDVQVSAVLCTIVVDITREEQIVHDFRMRLCVGRGGEAVDASRYTSSGALSNGPINLGCRKYGYGQISELTLHFGQNAVTRVWQGGSPYLGGR